MKIIRLDPVGIHQNEIPGIDALEAGLPNRWLGYSNLRLRSLRGRQAYEVDVVLVTHDRIILVDLKQYTGKIRNRDNKWYTDKRSRGRSPVLKILDHAKSLPEIIRQEIQRFGAPPFVEGFVVLTHPLADLSELPPGETPNVRLIGDFIRLLTDPSLYHARFDPNVMWNERNALCDPPARVKLEAFFSNGEVFEPRELEFNGYRPIGDATFQHPNELYSEYFSERPDNSKLTALLRYWNFQRLSASTSVAEERRSVADREHSALAHIREVSPELYSDATLHSLSRDEDYEINYWELFDLQRTTSRILEFIQRRNPSLERRLAISSILLGRLSALHRAGVAHRDVAAHSVWFDEMRSKLVLSAFGAAHFPDRTSLGPLRSRVVAAAARLPEDADNKLPAMPFRQDVFLAAVLSFRIITGSDVQRSNDDVPVFSEATALGIGANVPAGLAAWFAKALQPDPRDRFQDAIVMQEAFITAAERIDAASIKVRLGRFERQQPPYMTYIPQASAGNARYQKWYSVDPNRPSVRVLVKYWAGADIGTDAHLLSCLSFLESAESLWHKQPPWTADILDFGMSQGVYLVQRVVSGEQLDVSSFQRRGVDYVCDIIAKLVRAVDAMHALSVPHGDLKPEHVLVDESGSDVSVRLVDLLEYNVPEDGNIQNAEYSPPEGGADPFIRDRFAVCKMAKEALSVFRDTSERASRVLSGVAKCGEGPAPWASFAPVTLAFDYQDRKERGDTIEISVGVRDTRGRSLLLSDNGIYRVVWSAKDKRLRILGMDEEIDVAFDQSGRPSFAVLKDVTAENLAFAQRRKTLEFYGQVSLRIALAPSIVDLQPLLDRPELQAQFQPQATLRIGREQHSPRLSETEARITDLWTTVIDVEEEFLAAVVVTGDVSNDVVRRVHLIPYEYRASDPQFERGEAVAVLLSGERIGELDVAMSTRDVLAVRRLRRSSYISPGTLLNLQSEQDRASLDKRRRAVARIIGRKSEIPALLGYFERDADVEPTSYVARIPTTDEYKGYSLNRGQREAFELLWTRGPLGLLQGPPGTGKTHFIAAFVHFALTKGGLRNALVLGQSHEAVNTVAERLLELPYSGSESLNLLRVGVVAKIGDKLIPYHSDAIQDQYRELFGAELKQRLRLAAAQLGLPADYVDEAFEFQSRVEPLVRQLGHPQPATVNEGKANQAAQRRGRLREALVGIVNSQWPEVTVSPETALDECHPRIAEKYKIRNYDGIRRLRLLFALANEWQASLSTKTRTLESFLARSRNVVCGTCVGIGKTKLGLEKTAFDLAVIDEAARCDPGELAVAMQSARRIILVGDHHQLPPVYERDQLRAVLQRLGMPASVREIQSDFERAFLSPYGRMVSSTLSEQYRMVAEIGDLVSSCFYKGQRLTTARNESPPHFGLLPAPFDKPLCWIDSSPEGTEQRIGTSYENVGEARLIRRILMMLNSTKDFLRISEQDEKKDEPLIGVICMYGAQKATLGRMLLESGLDENFISRIKIDTVDGYQGKENRIVIISLVRNNSRRDIGHVSDERRINVALSRAMDRLIVVGSTNMFEHRGSRVPLTKVLAEFRRRRAVHAPNAISGTP